MQVLVVRWVGNVGALFVAAWLLDGISYGDRWWTLLLAGAVFTLVNTAIKPIVTVLSIPLIVVTLGVFYLVVNAAMLKLTDALVGQFAVRGFWTAVAGAVVVAVVNGALHVFVPVTSPRRVRRRSIPPSYT